MSPLLATPWSLPHAVYQAPPSMGFSRQEYWKFRWYLMQMRQSLWYWDTQNPSLARFGLWVTSQQLLSRRTWDFRIPIIIFLIFPVPYPDIIGEGNGNPFQYSCLENPWTEEPGGLQSMGSQRVGHDWTTNTYPDIITFSVLWHSAFFIVQLSHPYMTTGKIIALTRQTFVGKVMSLLFNMLVGHTLVITFLEGASVF